jgi:uroporphyrin-III C-methyltransferase
MTVYLVGAGPGDPGLITVRGLELLRRAEVLVYDRLIGSELLDEAPAGCLLVDASKRPDQHTMTQDEIDACLVEHGLAGRLVVRLKGGDPFVFGRGGEEVEALVEAGVPYEVVPGVSTLTAVPGLAGIPLTHRGTSAQVTVITGTTGDGSDLDFPRLASTPGTLVVFMGLRRLAHIADNLILNGRPVDQPAAVVSNVSLPNARVVVGTLGTIASTAADLPSPSLVIIGDVAALAWKFRAAASLEHAG